MVIIADISQFFCDRGCIIWYVGFSEMLIALYQTTRRHISKQHNHVLTVLCECAEEDLGLPGGGGEEVTRGWTEEVAGGQRGSGRLG